MKFLDRAAPGSEASQATFVVLTFHGQPDTMPKPLRLLSTRLWLAQIAYVIRRAAKKAMRGRTPKSLEEH